MALRNQIARAVGLWHSFTFLSLLASGCELDVSKKTACRYDGDCADGYVCKHSTCLPFGVRYQFAFDEDALWLGTSKNESLVLSTYAKSPTVLIDVRHQPKGATIGRYSGTRHDIYVGQSTIDASCLNGCDIFGPNLSLSCNLDPLEPRYFCDSVVFERVEATVVAQGG